MELRKRSTFFPTNASPLADLVLSFIFQPFHNLLSPVIAALMSGNAIVIKTSENVAWSSSSFAAAIRSCLEACGHSPDIVQVLIGCEGEAARSLTRSREISHLTFIGSDKVGKEIAKDAAENLLPVTLELGGKVSRINRSRSSSQADVRQMRSTGSLHTTRRCRCRFLQGCLHEGDFVSHLSIGSLRDNILTSTLVAREPAKAALLQNASSSTRRCTTTS